MQIINIAAIKNMCHKKALRWTDHMLKRILQRSISMDDVENALNNGEIIEQYPEDYPHPSCLVLGMSASDKPIHVVCGLSKTELWLITSYYPDEEEWEANSKTRKETTQ